MDFEQLYQMVERSSNECAFNKGECQKLYEIATKIPPASWIVEIGVQFGRSATVLGMAAKERAHDFVAIDNYQEEVSPRAKENVEKVLIGEMGLPIQLWVMTSEEAAKKFPDVRIDLYLS